MLLCGKAVSTNRQLGFSFGAWVKALVSSPQVRRCCVTRPPAPWMDNETILNLQSQTDKLRRGAHQSNSESSWSAFREARNKIKSAIRKARKAFMEKAFLSKSLKKSGAWFTMYSTPVVRQA